MPDPHISNLDIENYKCFEKLEMKNIQRVNLVGGKNNVGKTALLETVYLLISDNVSRALLKAQIILERRQSIGRKSLIVDFFYNSSQEFKIQSKGYLYGIKRQEGQKSPLSQFITQLAFDLGFAEKEIEISEERFLLRNLTLSTEELSRQESVIFLYSTKCSEEEVAVLFGSLINLDKEEFLNSSLSLFDKNIISFKQIITDEGVVLKLKLKDQENLVLLSSMGEGVSRYVSVLCAIWASKDGVLLIDEIENGIHYTNLPKLWEIIFEVSKEANCQVFATSHSKECIESFNEAQNQYGDGMYFELFQNVKTGQIDIADIDQEQLQYSLTHEGAIRGE